MLIFFTSKAQLKSQAYQNVVIFRHFTSTCEAALNRYQLAVSFFVSKLIDAYRWGGVRGLSAIVLLEQLMEVANDQRARMNLAPQRPWEMFDMIGGTSTGG
jgi:hypothetical protein